MKMKRRQFIAKASTVFAGVNFLPGRVWAESPNGKLNLIHIGVGGMGGADRGALRGHKKVNVLGLCDIDAGRLQAAKKDAPMAETYSDYREIFEKMGDRIDAAVVSTPDHTHAPASMLALNLGKHVYCQKPLTHGVYEARQVRLIAEKKGVATQMGIQIHSSNEYRTATKMIQEGIIGKVSEVHAWSNKNWGYDGPAFEGEDAVPNGLDWDMWIGTAEMRPYKKGVYHPSNWRKLIDFGTGTLGDMGVHIFDTPFRALELTFPEKVKTSCRKPTGVGHPGKNLVRYEFPGTKYTTDRLIWSWYDGGYAPPKDIKLGERKLPGQASLFIGEKGKMLLPHIGNPQFFDNDNQMQRVRLPQLDRINHYHQWADAAMGEGEASANFNYAGKLTESLLLGCVANRFPDEELLWDAANLKFTNKPEADKIIRRTYRKGFEVENL